ncbi:Calx-beta domain protein [Planctomycetes bacterium MalM25]|nr:Calx-beta domain protein [Planctomycetes bacterium MalM25]
MINRKKAAAKKSSKTNTRLSTTSRHTRLSIEGLENRNLLAVAVFQQGLSNYTGQEDTVLYSRDPDVNFGTEGSISPDQQDSNGARQGLLQFNDIIGDDAGQIPVGSRINSATLVVDVVNDSNSAMQMSLYRMLTPWSEASATWNTFGEIGGVQASEGEASDLPPDAILFDPDVSTENPLTAGRFDVSRSLQYWAAGQDNNGWMIESSATNGWDFRTKESAQTQRPRLEIDFTAPGDLGASSVKFLNDSQVIAEGDAGVTNGMVDIARSGDVSGPLTVNYTTAAGTAQAGDLVETTSSVTFAAGEAFAQIPVDVNGDETLEGNETLTVTLSGATIIGDATKIITIGDDDALINEVLANISNASDETDREFVELIGTPGAPLDGYYFVVFEAEEEEAGGTPDPNGPATGSNGSGAGVADLVIDLSGQTFGANGLLVITPTNWAYTPDADTNVFATDKLDSAGGVLEDASQTYALVKSPTALVEGFDYDQVGFYENETNQAIGEGVGVLDQLPAGAQVIDSVGVVEGGGGDRDRTLAPAEIGNPGIHVHQPTRINTASGNVTSDAVSRRIGQTIPNSIGAWFNGDIGDGDDSNGPIEYQNDTFFISVVAPDGSVLTPGAPNVLRTVFFDLDDQQTEVAEADGSVTVTLRRTGDIANEAVDVTYRTVGGTAVEGVDYTGKTETITFAAGEAEKQITIDLIDDGIAEGFERFSIEVTEVTGDYLITNGRATQSGAMNGLATVTIEDANVQIATFQNGINGYFGTEDAYLDGELTFNRFGQGSIVRVDQVKGEGEDPITQVRPQQGLIKFDDLFGAGLNQVPEGATIFDAFLTVNVTNVSSGAEVNFFQMQQDWEEVNASWFDPQGSTGSSILNGVTPDGVEANVRPDGTVPDAGRAGLIEIPLNVDTIQDWANGSDENYGWSIISDASSLWSFNSSEAFLVGTFRPELTILYTDPVAEDVGTFSLAASDLAVNELAGTAELTINRIGGSSGSATVDWAVTPGTGDLNDIGTASGQVTFADGELSKTFSIAITDDELLETNESLNVTISGAGLSFGRDTEVLTIRDNDFNPFGSDLLLNEIWINSPGNDPPFEFVELTGTAGVGMGSLYYIAVEGLVGDRTGVAEKVVDIGGFSNGANGHTILTPTAADFGFNVPAGATQIDTLGTIDEENVASQNDSTTYLLVYSPFTELTTTSFDYDWDDDGALELPPGVTIVDSVGVPVADVEDQLYGPGTNRADFADFDPEVDAISRTNGNTARNSGAAWFGGDLFPAGDDYLLYEAAEAFGLPVDGAALTPGEENVAADSALVSLTGATANPDGTITLNFNGPVSQFNLGDGGITGPGGTGVTLTDENGLEVVGVDALPTITGFGSNAITLSFTGAAVVGGQLPTGTYQLNLVGNAITGNGRAIDAANTTSSTGSDAVAEVIVGATVGDYNGDGRVDAADYTVFRDTFGSTIDLRADGDGDGEITDADRTIWANNYGSTGGNLMIGSFDEPVPATTANLPSALVFDEVFAVATEAAEAVETLVAPAVAFQSPSTPELTSRSSTESTLAALDAALLLLEVEQGIQQETDEDQAPFAEQGDDAVESRSTDGLQPQFRSRLA